MEKSTPGEYRLIHNLSFPAGQSINDGIPRDFCRVEYARFDDAVALVRTAGEGALMAKSDIKSAFRLLPIAPEDFELLGFKFEGKYYFDKALPMGAGISCSHFEEFATFLEYKVREITGSKAVIHYLDDFFMVGRKGSEFCGMLLHAFQKVCDTLGVPLAVEKTEGPTTIITFLGLEINSDRQVVRVPQEKLSKLKGKLQRALEASFITLREIQALIGLLNFVCRAVSPGRAFMRRLIDLTIGVHDKSCKVQVGRGAKQDMRMWLNFLENYNGVSVFLPATHIDNFELELFTDAAGSIGMGAYFKGHWTQLRWPAEILRLNLSIAFLELYPIVVSVILWGSEMANRKILFRSDNQAVVSVINKQTSKCSRVMSLVRILVLQCLMHNIVFSAKHIPGVDNSIADALSRFQVQRFRSLAPDADREGTPCPLLMLDILK